LWNIQRDIRSGPDGIAPPDVPRRAIALAIRLARALTGNLKIVKFRIARNDGAGTIGQDPNAGLAVVVLDWGDADALEGVLTSDFAAVLLEPAAINSGCFEPPDGLLQSVRALTSRRGLVLI
jgi:glutamate-1-semialdehyde 2,1-aminomutase